MKKLLWVHRDAFDVILDRATWINMALELKLLGVDTTIIGAYEKQPIAINSSIKMKWVGPLSGGLANVLILIKIWQQVISEVIRNKPEFIILDIPSFICAFPFDLLSKVGLYHCRVVLDLRTFNFGVISNKPSLKDRYWYIYTRCALWYNRLFHYGITTITKPLAQKVIELQSSRNIEIWSSGCTLPNQINDLDSAFGNMIDELAKDHFLIIYHGCIHPNRGLAQAVKGVQLANEHGTNIVFIILGDGPGNKELTEFILQNDADECCKILPPIGHERVFGVISKSRLGIMTYPNLDYWTYNHPIKLAEYLSMGKPVLCTNILMFHNAVQDIDCLFFVENNSPELIADQLVRIFNDSAELERRSLAAKEEAKRLTWAHQANILITFLNHA